MKKHIVLSFIILISYVAIGQPTVTDKEKLNTISFSPSAFINSSFELSYERQLKENFAVSINSGITYKLGFPYYKKGIKIGLQVKFLHPLESIKYQRSLYIAPYIDFSYLEGSYYGYHRLSSGALYSTAVQKVYIPSFSCCILSGYKASFDNNFSIGLYMGPGFKIFEIHKSYVPGFSYTNAFRNFLGYRNPLVFKCGFEIGLKF